MQQQIEPELMKEFEEEMNNLAKLKTSNSIIPPSTTRQYKPFWDRFLNEQFPEGQINKVLEKNFAIWIFQNNINFEQVKEIYKKNKWNPSALLGWLKKVLNGEITEYNPGEVYLWAVNNKPELCQNLIELSNPIEENHIKKDGEKEIKLIWDKDLKNYQCEQINWVIENIIKTQSINVIAGKRSTLKSWFCLIAGYSIAKGIDFLGQFKVQTGNVLYLDRENQFSGLKERSAMVKRGLEFEDDVGVAFLSESYVKIDSPEDMIRIEKIIKENNVKLMICDVYRRLISYDENDAGEVSKLFVDILKPLTERTGVSILLIHHERKGESSGDDMDMLRGSSDLANYVDMIIQVERKGDSLIVKQSKNRSGKELEPFQIKIETDEETLFKLKYMGNVENTTSHIAKTITNWIIYNKIREFSFSKVIKYCEEQGYKQTSAKAALNELLTNGFITKGDGKFGLYTVSTDMRLE